MDSTGPLSRRTPVAAGNGSDASGGKSETARALVFGGTPVSKIDPMVRSLLFSCHEQCGVQNTVMSFMPALICKQGGPILINIYL